MAACVTAPGTPPKLPAKHSGFFDAHGAFDMDKPNNSRGDIVKVLNPEDGKHFDAKITFGPSLDEDQKWFAAVEGVDILTSGTAFWINDEWMLWDGTLTADTTH